MAAARRAGRRLRPTARQARRLQYGRWPDEYALAPRAPVSRQSHLRVPDTARRRPGCHNRDSVRGGRRIDPRVAERGMSKIRALVVDDEPMARDRVLSLLQHEEDVEVVGECGDGTQAVSAIHNQAPDLVFLDVQMPGHN